MEKLDIKKRFFDPVSILKGLSQLKRSAHTELKGLNKRKVESRHKRAAPMLKFYMERAGIKHDVQKFNLLIFRVAVFVNLLISFYLIYKFSTDLKVGPLYVTVIICFIWLFIFAFILFIMWLFVFVLIDLRIFKRRVGIEEVLPDYLQLTSANIRAGMPIDRALWYAVRPRFGVLANEIEMVAKETMSGEELESALKRFTDKYDSIVLKRAISLLIESYNAGGEVGEILNKIADNIKENQLMKKEMAANVTTYAIFITFASICAAPVLFALSGVFLKVITGILEKVDFSSLQESGSMGFSFTFSEASITSTDFTIFSVVSLTLTAIFSAAIVASIKKGDVRSGISYIPVFICVSLVIYFISSIIFSSFLGGLF